MCYEINFVINLPLEFIKKAFKNKDNYLNIHLYNQVQDVILKQKDNSIIIYVDNDLFITQNFYVIEDTDFSFKYILCIEKINNIKIPFPFYYCCYYYKNSCQNTTVCFFQWTSYNKINYYSKDLDKYISQVKKNYLLNVDGDRKKNIINKFEENIKKVVKFLLVYKSTIIKNIINSYLNLLFNPKNIY